jgi:HlyD family secretion protein
MKNKISNIFQSAKVFLKNFWKEHRIWSVIIILVLLYGVYYTYGKISTALAPAQYVMTKVTRGDIVTSITGSGQIYSNQEVDIKPKVSGTVTYVNVKAGQQVYKGQALAYMDSKDAERSVRDAEINLESSQIALEKLKRNQDSSGNSISNNLAQSYKDAYSKISDVFLNLPGYIDLSRGVLYDTNVSGNDYDNIYSYNNSTSFDYRDDFKKLIDRAETDYAAAKADYTISFETYRNLRVDATNSEIESALKMTQKTTELISQAVKSEQNMLDALVSNIKDNAPSQGHGANINAQILTYQSSIGSAIGKLNTFLSNINSNLQSIQNAKDNLADATLSNPIDIKSQENTVSQKQANLQDAKDNLSYYTIVAPFSGTLSAVNMESGDTVNTGTAIATVLAKQTIAKISLNEVDFAKVSIGQNVDLTFDAVPGLTIKGNIIETDSMGTVSQGVVTYGIQIGLSTQDDRVKPGMSVSATIITDTKTNVLRVASGAIKTTGGKSYVQILPDVSVIGMTGNNQFASSTRNFGNRASTTTRDFATTSTMTRNLANFASSTRTAIGVKGVSTQSVSTRTTPVQQLVLVGSSNGIMTEIISGLSEGDYVVSKAVSTTAAAPATATSARSGLGAMRF